LSSGYHMWPYQVDQTPAQQALWARWPDKRAVYRRAVADALQSGQPITDPPMIHPERSLLNYPLTDQAVGRLLMAVAGCEPATLALQCCNVGSVSNFPEDAVVEVPVRVEATS